MITEKAIENKIKKLLTEQGAYFFKHFGCKFSRVGVPDIIACINGRFIGIEVKRENGVLSEVQKIHLQQIKNAGGIGIVARSVEDVKEALCLNCTTIKKSI